MSNTVVWVLMTAAILSKNGRSMTWSWSHTAYKVLASLSSQSWSKWSISLWPEEEVNIKWSMQNAMILHSCSSFSAYAIHHLLLLVLVRRQAGNDIKLAPYWKGHRRTGAISGFVPPSIKEKHTTTLSTSNGERSSTSAASISYTKVVLMSFDASIKKVSLKPHHLSSLTNSFFLSP